MERGFDLDTYYSPRETVLFVDCVANIMNIEVQAWLFTDTFQKSTNPVFLP